MFTPDDDDRDEYEILGLAPGATLAEIKQAFRRLAQQYHPDRNPNDPYAAREFQKISAAYESLWESLSRETPEDIPPSPEPEPVPEPEPFIPRSATAWDFFCQAMVHKRERDYAATLTALGRAIAANPDFFEAYLERLRLRYTLLDDRGVLEDCRQALRLEPEAVLAHYWQGRARQRLGYVDSAISAYSRVIKLQPNYAPAHYRRGLAHQDVAEPELARQDLLRAKELFRQQQNFQQLTQVETALENLRSSSTYDGGEPWRASSAGAGSWGNFLVHALLGPGRILILPGQIGQVFARLSPPQAAVVGVGFAALAITGCLWGLTSTQPSAPQEFQQLLRRLGLGLVPFGISVLLTAILRWAGGTGQHWGTDWFLAGAGLLPAAYVGWLLRWVSGVQWQQGIAPVAVGHAALILYFGCTRILRLSEGKAAVAVPVLLLATGWLTRLTWLNLLPIYFFATR